MKYVKNTKNKREEILSNFSIEEKIELCEKLTAFSKVKETADFLNANLKDDSDIKDYRDKAWNDTITERALIGLGIGGGLGGLYGAFKKKRKEDSRIKEMLKYGLLGAGLGGVGGGLAGVYAYDTKNPADMAKLDTLSRDYVKLHNDNIIKEALEKADDDTRSIDYIRDLTKNNPELMTEVLKDYKPGLKQNLKTSKNVISEWFRDLWEGTRGTVSKTTDNVVDKTRKFLNNPATI